MSSKNKTKQIENKIPFNDFFSNKIGQDDKTSVNNQVT